MKEITVKISRSNFESLKRMSKPDKTVNKALKQFFRKNHKMKVRTLLKRGYRIYGDLNLKLAAVLNEDALF